MAKGSMTWKDFKDIVERSMEEQGIEQDVQIQFIVAGNLNADRMFVKLERGLSISNEKDRASLTTEAVGTMTWRQFKRVVEEEVKRQDISSASQLWFIDVLKPHADEEARIDVRLDEEEGIAISNI